MKSCCKEAFENEQMDEKPKSSFIKKIMMAFTKLFTSGAKKSTANG